MKKLFLLIAVVSISTGVWAQRGKVTAALSFIEQGALDKAKKLLMRLSPMKNQKTGSIHILLKVNFVRLYSHRIIPNSEHIAQIL